jgi:DNA mismatch endonuclease, patch repair protein
MDTLSKDKRSWNMSRIRSKDTKPEKLVRSVLHRMGYRFRLHVKELPGNPDVVLPRYHTVIFVHGCFWHRHTGCKYAYQPKTRIEFWNRKFEQNVRADERASHELHERGWRVITLWECELPNADNVAQMLSTLLPSRGSV